MTDSHDSAAPEACPEQGRESAPPPISQCESAEAESSAAQADSAAAGDPPDDPGHDPVLDFLPVGVRYRYDGWTPDKQAEFIGRLADCGCVEEAARSVGMSRNSAYALRRRPDAAAFRLAWDAAMEQAVARLSDAAMARAINGVAVPIFQGGEQVGERRHFDERLTMFLLRYRDPARYGQWLDRIEARQAPDGPAMLLAYRIARMVRAAWLALDAALRGEPAPEPEAERISSAPAVDGR